MENKDYEFKLTPAYCLYNGAAVLEQKGAYVKILMDHEDEKIRKRIQKAFKNYVEKIIEGKDCPAAFNQKIKVDFVYGTRMQLKKCISGLYERNSWERSSFVVAEEGKKFGVKNQNENQKENQRNEKNRGGEKKNDEFLHESAAAVLLLDSLLNEARERKATDIHIEKNKIKMRVNGKLEVYMELSEETAEELIQRIKLLGDMNVLEKQKSQNGHFSYGEKNPLYVRVSSVGIVGEQGSVSAGKESVVLRILDPERVPLDVEKLGFSEEQLRLLEKLCSSKNGLIIVSGSTGSGKSTTCSSLLMAIQKFSGNSLKILTLEDPPEYVIPDVTQIQVEDRKGISFEEGLEQIFRQDPDVIMIGEIRDKASAVTAVRGALTGHLVFATVHAGSAEETFMRIAELTEEEDVLASVLKGVISQELNYVDDQVNLLADVSVFKEGITVDENAAGDSESDGAVKGRFDHCSNYSEVITRSLKQMYWNRKCSFVADKTVLSRA